MKANAPAGGRHLAAALWLGVHLLVTLALLLAGRSGLALALAVPLAVHAADLARLRKPEFLRTPLRKVGFRELALSSLFSVLVVAALV
jgi:hypothetical protein